MSKMVDQVARAIRNVEVKQVVVPRQNRAALSWDQLTDELRDSYRIEARVAIEAMREPTVKMTGAGSKPRSLAGPLHLADKVWRAMIDEALK